MNKQDSAADSAVASTSSPAAAMRMMSRLARSGRFGGALVPTLLGIVLAIHLLQQAAPVLLPLTLALLLSMLLWPVLRALGRIGLPQPVAAAIILLLAVSGSVAALYGLSGPAADWIRRAPITLQQVEWKLRDLKRPIEEIREATKAVSEATSVEGESDEGKVQVEMREPSVLEMVVDSAPTALMELFVTLVALFFFLAWGDGFTRRLLGCFRDDRIRRRTGHVLREVRRDVTQHLGTITLINVALGMVVGALLLAVGYPNPMLWGFSVALLNFAPFVGSMLALVGVAVVGLVSFPTLTPTLIATVSFGALTALEGYFITPAILGRRLALDPIAILLSLLVWGWLWGPMGLLMAVPLLVCIRLVWRSATEVQRAADDGDARDARDAEAVSSTRSTAPAP